ncbi:zinc knuckle CX2CX4HX4C containing protein [Tanacetum coccineum]
MGVEKSDKLNVREGTARNQGVDAFGASCDGSPKVRNSYPLVSPTATINRPHGLYNVDVVATFGVPLTTVGDLDVLTNDTEAGKHKELLSGMTNDKRKAVMDALVAMCDSIQAENTNADAIPCKVSHVNGSTIIDALVAKNLNVDESLIVQSVSIQDKPSVNVSIPRKVVKTISTRFADTLYVYFIGKRIEFPVVEYYFRNNWGKYGLTRIMMNSKGFFFFQFKTLKGLEDVLGNASWMIRNSPIILKKWSMSTRLCKEELTRIPGRSNFARYLIEINAEDVLKESLTIGVPLIEDTRFTIETVIIEYEWKLPHCDLCKIFGHVHDHCPKKVSIPITVVTPNVPTPTVEMTNDGFQTVRKKKKKGKSKSINGGQIGGHSVKLNVRYEPKATTSAPKKGATNLGNASKLSSMKNQPPKATIISTKEGKITMSNSYAALEDESDEDVENLYNESANFFHSKTSESSSTLTTAARLLVIPTNFLTGLNEADTISIDVADESFDVCVTRIAVGVTTYRYEYHLNRTTCNKIVDILQLQPGTCVVFTKKSDRRFDLMGFNDETCSHITLGRFIGVTNLNELHPGKAIIRHENIEHLMTIKTDFHKEDPARDNNVGVYGKWREFGRECHFDYNKMIRFIYLHNVESFGGDDEGPFPLFELC